RRKASGRPSAEDVQRRGRGARGGGEEGGRREQGAARARAAGRARGAGRGRRGGGHTREGVLAVVELAVAAIPVLAAGEIVRVEALRVVRVEVGVCGGRAELPERRTLGVATRTLALRQCTRGLATTARAIRVAATAHPLDARLLARGAFGRG